MKQRLALGSRVLLGLIYVVFGFNGFFQFLPMPPMPEAAGAFLGGLAGSGYFFPFLKVTEIAGGALLLSNRFPALGLVVLAPVTLNIFLFHVFLAPGVEGLFLPVLMMVMTGLLACAYHNAYASVLKCRVGFCDK